MELTPIKVRGKRPAKGEPVPTPQHKRHKRDGLERVKKPRRSKASTIEEELPLEILERIFWMSENLNFPRASPRIGRLLSGSSTLRQIFLRAFEPTWAIWYGCVHFISNHQVTLPWIYRTQVSRIHSYTGWKEDSDRFGGNPELQTALLEYSWCTIDLIMDCWDIWVKQHAQHRPFDGVPLWPDHTDPIRVREIEEKVSSYKPTSDATRCFYKDYVLWQCPDSPSRRGGGSTYLDVHVDTRIPDKLLSGPWEDGRALRKLFWLVRAGARIHDDQWEATREGWGHAIKDTENCNRRIVALFEELDVFAKWPSHVTAEEFEKLARDLKTTSTLHLLDRRYNLLRVLNWNSMRLRVLYRTRYEELFGDVPDDLLSSMNT